jgi:hypothetical protein
MAGQMTCRDCELQVTKEDNLFDTQKIQASASSCCEVKHDVKNASSVEQSEAVDSSPKQDLIRRNIIKAIHIHAWVRRCLDRPSTVIIVILSPRTSEKKRPTRKIMLVVVTRLTRSVLFWFDGLVRLEDRPASDWGAPDSFCCFAEMRLWISIVCMCRIGGSLYAEYVSTTGRRKKNVYVCT